MHASRKYLVFITSLAAGALLVFSGFFKSESAGGTRDLPEIVDFNFHIKPIISDRCFKCHGPDKAKQEAELGLIDEAGFFKALKDDPTKFVVVPGSPDQSELYNRLISHDSDLLMPPPESNLSLNEREIALVKKWIEQGAKYKKHWAFIPPVKSPIPEVRQKEWASNEIDYFVLEGLEKAGLEPNESADKERLLRRVSYDLTGLPPTEELMDEFMKDPSADAYEKIVDKLMSSQSFGEHQAVFWLDLARYADSHGYQDDSYRSMWPWRDWVINAFNKNLPYDEFVTWQLAGDLMPEAGKEQLLATGFNRNHKITQEGGVIEEEYRVEYTADKTNTFGLAFLGLTYECARCHTHKYDPITHEEYFKTYAFFNQSAEKGFYGDVSTASIAEPPVLVPSKEELEGILGFINDSEADTVVSMVMQDLQEPRKTFILKRGQYDAPDLEVGFGTPAAVLPFSDELPRNRLGLARWTFDPANPLPARVAVNRFWQQFFGFGIVKTSDNFGSQGELPSHPELLDWLAVDFRESGWDIKRLLKKIVTSATYRQSAVVSKEKLELDPENRLLSRGPRFRMSPEMIRDTWLAASGLLHRAIGGPPVRPYQPEGLWEETNAGDGRGSLTKYVQDTSYKLYRRTMYTIFKRTLPHPFLTTFDASYRDVCAIKRQRTNTPLQALNLMNDPTMLDASNHLAEQLMKEGKVPIQEKVTRLFRIIAGRTPADQEKKILQSHYEARKSSLAKTPDLANQLLGNSGRKVDNSLDPVSTAALADVAALVFNMDEVINK